MCADGENKDGAVQMYERAKTDFMRKNHSKIKILKQEISRSTNILDEIK